MAHGSRNPEAFEAHLALCDAVGAAASERSGDPVEVRPAFLEINDPSLPDAVDAAVADGATRIRVVPHFLGPGNHVRTDIPELVRTAKGRHPDVQLELSTHLGADPRLVVLLADLAVGPL